VAAYVTARKRRARRAAALASQGFVSTGLDQRSVRRHLPFGLFLAALALLGIALAKPMATIHTPRREATVVLAMDISNSMAATDVKPSRIGAAKLAANAFVKYQPSSVRIGVVAFGPSAVIVQPPTTDHAAVLHAINQLSLGGGTSVASGILTALDAISGKTLSVNLKALNEDNPNEINIGFYGGTTIVLISDGEDTSDVDPVTMARLASVAGVRIETIGVGTAAGTTVSIDGFNVATALNAPDLQQVAKVTNGSYHYLSGPGAVTDVAKTINLHFVIATEYTQISAIFAAGGAVLLILGALLSVSWFGRVV
jgi:Ca-activated chloride channel homolog